MPKIRPQQDYLIDLGPGQLSQGLYQLLDDADAPVGSSRVMTNMMITDKGGLSPRPGTRLLGTYDSSTSPIDGLYNYVKSFATTEIPIKAVNGELKYFHPTLLDWYRLKNGYTVGSEFGFKESLVNTDSEDYLYFCNRSQYYSRWSGATTKLLTATTGGETVLITESLLKTPSLLASTATSSSTTTLTVSTANWGVDMWKNFYVYITNGSQSGVISKISSNTSTILTFDSITDPGNCTFEIVQLKFPATGTLIVGTTEVAYTAISNYDRFTVASAPALAINSPVTVVPTEYAKNPRGNRLELQYTRMIVGNVLSAMSKDSSGNVQGSQSTGSFYYSKGGIGKLADPTDFGFTATRVAGEGGIESTPWGGGDITDIANQEDKFYVFKKTYIEAVTFSQDTNDIPLRTQLKTGFGSLGKVVKGKDDIYFVTADNQLTSIGRVKLADTVPQSVNMGIRIKRLLDNYDFSRTGGIEHKDRLFFICKQSSDDNNNNQIIVYNRRTKSFEGIWLISANGFIKYQNNLHYGESIGSNVWQMFTGITDYRSAEIQFNITSQWRTNWMHVAPGASRSTSGASKFEAIGVNTFAMEGSIRDGTNITISLFANKQVDASLSFDFGISDSDEEFKQDLTLDGFLGTNPLGLAPMGSISNADENGDRYFRFIVYFPDIYANYFSLGLDCSGGYYEINRLALNTYEEVSRQSIIKTI